jgi:hypothetical protein
MASGHSTSDLQAEKMAKALKLIQEDGASLRYASEKYGIPKSTIGDHLGGRVKGSKRGQSTVLTEEEEEKIANWAMEMSKMGHVPTREQITEMVKVFLDEDGRSNPFVDNRPGKSWWYGFLRRHPHLTMPCSPEQLQVFQTSDSIKRETQCLAAPVVSSVYQNHHSQSVGKEVLASQRGKCDPETVQVVMDTIEATLCSETKEKFEDRYQTGYDATTDELYNVWSKVKALTLQDSEGRDVGSEFDETTSLNFRSHGWQGTVSQAHNDLLTISKSPAAVEPKKNFQGVSATQPHITGNSSTEPKEEKRFKKEEIKKQGHKGTRVGKCSQEQKKINVGIARVKKSVTYTTSQEVLGVLVKCPLCGKGEDEEGYWFCCDLCDTWYHADCAGILPSDYARLRSGNWYCAHCLHY